MEERELQYLKDLLESWLEELRHSAGNTVEVELRSAEKTDVVLQGLDEAATWKGASSAKYENGRWHVTLKADIVARADVDDPPDDTELERAGNPLRYQGEEPPKDW